jgi:hypothetical protein
MKKNPKIHISKFYKLISFTTNNQISTNYLSLWLEQETDREFIVIEKHMIKDAIKNMQDYSSMVKKLNDEFEKNGIFIGYFINSQREQYMLDHKMIQHVRLRLKNL